MVIGSASAKQPRGGRRHLLTAVVDAQPCDDERGAAHVHRLAQRHSSFCRIGDREGAFARTIVARTSTPPSLPSATAWISAGRSWTTSNGRRRGSPCTHGASG